MTEFVLQEKSNYNYVYPSPEPVPNIMNGLNHVVCYWIEYKNAPLI